MSYVKIPSCNFEMMGNINSFISESIIYKLKHPDEDYSIYDSTTIDIKDDIWENFEVHINHLLCQIRYVLREKQWDWFSICYAMSQSIVVEARVLDEIVKTILGDHGANPFYADKKDLILYYAERLSEELGIENFGIKNEEHIFAIWPLNKVPKVCKYDDYRRKEVKTDTDEWPKFDNVIYYNTKNATKTSASLRKLVASQLAALSRILYLAYLDCDYYTTKNTFELSKHISSIRETWGFRRMNVQIKTKQDVIYKALLHNYLLEHTTISNQVNQELRQEALFKAAEEIWPEAYKSYKANSSVIEREHNDMAGIGLTKAWMNNLLKNVYEGEQRDISGKLISVQIDEQGRTHIVGKSGWEKWIELLMVAALLQDNEERRSAPLSDALICKAIVAALSVDGKDSPKWAGIYFAWKKEPRLPQINNTEDFINLMNSPRFKDARTKKLKETARKKGKEYYKLTENMDLRRYSSIQYLNDNSPEDWTQDGWNRVDTPKINWEGVAVAKRAAIAFKETLDCGDETTD